MDLVLLYSVCAFRSDRKFESNFLSFVWRMVFRNFCWSMCLGRVSKALLISIMVNKVLLMGGGILVKTIKDVLS